MTIFRQGDTIMVSGYGFADRGPYIQFNDITTSTQYRFPVQGKTFSMIRHDRRFCVGRFDLATFKSSVCPLKVEFLSSEKDDMCPACREATGFNPSFYFADSISLQQQAYNATPHYVYLAYFASGHVKAGISSETRGIGRLLEQGARCACVVGRFSNADDARKLEAALCAQEGIAETMRVSLKARLLVEKTFHFEEGCAAIQNIIDRVQKLPEVIGAGFTPETIQDLSSYYFGEFVPDNSQLQIPDKSATECGGTCVGMVGGLLIMQQGDFCYVIALDDWETYVVDLFEDEVRVTYDSVPQQTSLF